jgi:hypothetical protein
MFRPLGILFCASFILASACSSPKLEEKERIASLADLTLRQLIAGLNAKNNKVLAKLCVVTSTTGGAPRPLRDDEVATLVYPDPPFEYQGAGKPGTMVLRDGHQQKRIVRLVEVGKEMKVLATGLSMSSYMAKESGKPTPVATGESVRVLSIMSAER